MYNVVWYRRDLRTVDHEPLHQAAAEGCVLPLYVADPEVWRTEDASTNHWDFVAECLSELREQLAEIGLPLIVRQGPSLQIFAQLHTHLKIRAVYSHLETANQITRHRDRSVRVWLKSRGIPWHQFQVGGVIPQLPTRNGWATTWERRMQSPLLTPPGRTESRHLQLAGGAIPTGEEVTGRDRSSQSRQCGGRAAGQELLASFLERRGARYHREMSSPTSAEDSCSRLSAHLTYGTLSMREVVQRLRQRQEQLRQLPQIERGSWLAALRAFDARLHWHCHFIQKLADDPQFEFEHVHSGSHGLGRKDDSVLLTQWSDGETGFPFIDACMRFLKAHGWINFRMRAMLASFASYHLWLNWRSSGLVLARMFTDYEPGIHWNQMQMQAGTTGINAPRIYNPVKQSHDQDPQGEFIKRWVPELGNVVADCIHEPWRMSLDLQRQSGCVIDKDYPRRIVDHVEAAKRARAAIGKMRQAAGFQEEASKILERHGSRKRSARRRAERKTKKKKDQSQLTFDL